MKIYSSKLMKAALFLAGSLLSALAFNLFLLPNNIVTGFSGIAVILNNLFGLRPSLILLIMYIVILILSFILVGKEKTKNSIVGSFLFPLFIEATAYMTPYIDLNNIEPIVMILCGAVMSGVGLGLVYKVGYTTGGSDVLNQILSIKLKKPMGACTVISNIFIILGGLFFFGFASAIYSIIVIAVMSVVIDKVMIGISQSKSFYVITEHETTVKKFLLSKLSHGVTIIPARGGYTGNELKLIMCIIPTKEYVTVKEGILAIDDNAMILVSDVYEIVGGK